MKILQILILLAAIAFGAFGMKQLQKLIGAPKTSRSELRYLNCIEQGKEANQCASEELLLRGLSCKS